VQKSIPIAAVIGATGMKSIYLGLRVSAGAIFGAVVI
jgi:hypothetical protein